MQGIADLREAVASWAGRFEASAVTVADCRRVVAETAAMQSMLAAAQAQAAARVADSGAWREEGQRSAAHLLARETGTTVGAAREALETGQRLQKLPELADAARRGLVSPAQTAAVASVGAVAPELVTRFLDRAQETTLGELREECARAVAAREPDPDEKRRRIRARRSLRTWIDAFGAGVMQLTDAPDVVAGLMAHLGPAREVLFAQARERGERVASEALAADALVATVKAGSAAPVDGSGDSDGDGASEADGAPTPAPARRSATPPGHRCAPRSKVLVRIDFDALLRGRAIDGEVCEIAGYGPIAVSAVRDMLATGDPFIAAVVTKGEQVVGVAHVGRKPLSLQVTALEWINPTCAVDGCTNAARLEIDHRRDWATTRFTLTDLLDRLCPGHHDLKTREDWALIEGSGKRRFVSPNDPRHPRSRLRLASRPRGDPTPRWA